LTRLRTAALAAAWTLAGAPATLAQETADEPGAAPAEPAGYAPGDSAGGLIFGGYLDLGFARAQGDGSSFHPLDTRLPADYVVDAFAPAVNSRGEVASTDAGARFTNGFLPRSAGIGNRPSFMVNTLDLDLRYEPMARSAPVLMFARVQLLPRFGARGSETRLLLEQAFARISPLPTEELAITVGRFDSVFGIEYLENQANLRTGITPSLIARYTTGTPAGIKVLYRLQIAPLWSTLSLNAAATSSSTFVEALQPAEISLTGVPVASARLGYELALTGFQIKLGASGLLGPRNDQGDRHARQRLAGADARVYVAGLSVAAEYVHVDEDPGTAADKRTGAGPQTIASEFHARGFYVVAAYEVGVRAGALRRATFYARGERRHAWFEGVEPVTVMRVTGGIRVDLWEVLSLKAEYLRNVEIEGAPTVANDVVAGSLVYTF
jgi:hypothetical protein